MKKNPIRILLANDHTITRKGLLSMLAIADDMEVIGEASNSQEVQKMVIALLPDVLLLDILMPEILHPFEVAEWVRKNHPQVIVLPFTDYHRERFLARAVTMGYKGYLTKELSAAAFLDAIRRASTGESVMTNEQIAMAKLWQQTIGESWNSLTHQEREVLRQISTGVSNLEIAMKLCITVKTVESHISNIFRKLDVDSRGRAIAWIHNHFLDGFPE